MPVYLLARRLVRGWWAVLAAGLSVGDPLVDLHRDRDDRKPLLPRSRRSRSPSIAWHSSGRRSFASSRSSRRSPSPSSTRPQFGSSTRRGSARSGSSGSSRRRCGRGTGRPDSALADGDAGARGCRLSSSRMSSAADRQETLGGYWVLWRGYDPVEVGKWFVYHLGDFAVYLAIVPVAVAPIVLWQLARAGTGRIAFRRGAFVALFASANVCGLLVVAAFTQHAVGFERLHDRYGFYLLPLWLVGLVVWLAAGLPRPPRRRADRRRRRARAPADPAVRQLANEAGIDTVPGALWVRIEAELAGPGPASGAPRAGRRRRRAPRRDVPAAATGRDASRSPAVVAISFAATSYFAWERMIDAPEDLVFAGGLERAWIDERRVPDDAHVVEALPRHELRLRARAARALTSRSSSTRSIDRRRLRRRHRSRTASRSSASTSPVGSARAGVRPAAARGLRPHAARHRLDGTTRRRGNCRRARALGIGGPVRAVGASSNEQLATLACA